MKIIGAIRASRSVNGLHLAETEYASGLSIESHPHSEPLCSVVLRGGLTERWGRSRIECDPGTLTWLPPGASHSQEHDDTGSRCFLVHFGDPWMRRMRELEVDTHSAPVPLRGAKANWLADQLYREFRSPDAASELSIEGFTLAMLGELARAPTRRERESRPGWLVRAAEILHDRMSGPVRMAEIARELEVHPTHLARTFREQFGCTMGEYLRRVRIDEARAQLVSTDRSLSAIALAAGFSDQAHFTRTFKRATGTTPGAWRAAHSRGPVR